MNNVFDKPTAAEIIAEVSRDMKRLRRNMKINQKTLAEMSGVSLGSIKRFERQSEISFHSLARIAVILGCEDTLMKLFKKRYYASIQDVIDEE